MTGFEDRFSVKEGFYGAVVLNDWTKAPWEGGQYIGFVGQVTILKDSELAGFEVAGRDSNWAARIEGPSGQAAVFNGCQVRGGYALTEGAEGDLRDFCRVP